MQPTKQTHIVIVDDHRGLAEALAMALTTDRRLVVKGLYTNPYECLDALVRGAKIDLILSDFSMPNMNGIEFLIQAKHIRADVLSILLTMHNVEELRFRCQRAGIEGYIPKTATVTEIHDHIQAVVMGRTEIETVPMDGSYHTTDNIVLTPSEIEVIRCVVCLELSSKAAAEFLNRSHHTVEQHRKNIYAKLGIDSVAALTKYALKAGICSEFAGSTGMNQN